MVENVGWMDEGYCHSFMLILKTFLSSFILVCVTRS